MAVWELLDNIFLMERELTYSVQNRKVVDESH